MCVDPAYVDNAAKLREASEAKDTYYAERVRERRWERRGIPLLMRETIRDGARETSSVKSVRAFIETDAWILLLTGNKGVGKSMAACLGVAIFERSAMFIPLSDLLHDGDYGLLREETMRVELLALDELGGEWGGKAAPGNGNADWALSRFWDLMDARYREKRKTIITANVDWDTLVAAYGKKGSRGEAFIDRAKQGGAVFEPTETESFRGKEP